jgi:hypothetical protein
MYSLAFGEGGADLMSEFEGGQYDYFEEFDQELQEVPMDKPYEFCNMIKHSNG